MEKNIQYNDQYSPFTYTMTPNPMLEDQRLNNFDTMTFIAVKYFANASTNKCWPSVKKLAEIAHCSERSVYKSLKRLEELKYISRQQRFNGKEKVTTIYTILPYYSAANKINSTDRETEPSACDAVRSACGADRTISNELDTKNNNKPPYIPLEGGKDGTEKTADEKQTQKTDLPKEAESQNQSVADPFRASCQYILHDYPDVKAQKIMSAVQRWNDLYGADFVLQQVKHALSWQADNPRRRKKDVVRFLGNWLRISAKNNRAEPQADPQVDMWFDQFWAAWPGLPDGKDGAREEWRRRFAGLHTKEQKNKALDALEDQLNDLIERGTDPKYIPRAKNFIRDASLEG